MKILVVEDEKKMADFVKRALKEQHYIVDVAHDSVDGLFFAETNPYDLIILDVMLPGKDDGIAICKKLRKKNIDTPILMLTAKNTIRDKVSGLDSGADDYLVKPFAVEELFARVRVLIRRKSSHKTTILKVADLELDQLKHKVTRSGKEINLTTTEYALLEYLMLNVNQAVTRTMISEHVWNDDFDSFSNVINVYMQYLRKKIDTEFSQKLIHSLRGTGYILKG